ncbi:hypothetical protein ACDY97_26875 [Rhizobium mongolense]|uniref:hypothetical protein n=1 Tax=Rhizobium mongolense TaxID=57676 RepID=UPI003557FED4
MSAAMTFPVSEMIVPALWSQTRENSAVPDETRSPTSRLAYQRKTVLPDFKGRDRDFNRFRTRIREGMREGPNFAGHDPDRMRSWLFIQSITMQNEMLLIEEPKGDQTT